MSDDGYLVCGCTPTKRCVDHATDWGQVRDPDPRHWVSRSDFDELEQRCDGLEREKLELQHLLFSSSGDDHQRAESLRDAEAYERLLASLPPGDTRSARVVLADAVVAAREGTS